MTANEIQNLVDDPDAEEQPKPEIGNREIDNLLDDPNDLLDDANDLIDEVKKEDQIDLDDELLDN